MFSGVTRLACVIIFGRLLCDGAVFRSCSCRELAPNGARMVPKRHANSAEWCDMRRFVMAGTVARVCKRLAENELWETLRIAYLRAASLPFANTRIFSVCLSCFFNIGRMAFPWCRECRAGWPRRLSGLVFWARANAVLSVFSKKTKRGSKAKMVREWLYEPFAPAIYLGQHRVSS